MVIIIVKIVVINPSKRGHMRYWIHRMLVICGAALVLLRFIPAEPGGYMSRLFLDSRIHDRLDGFAVKMILAMGVEVDQYQTQLTGLMSLAHVGTIFAQAIAIGVIFYVITRWI
jgi:hypothetical protein